MDVASENSEEMWTSTTFRPQIVYDRRVFCRVPLSQLHPNMLFGGFFNLNGYSSTFFHFQCILKGPESLFDSDK